MQRCIALGQSCAQTLASSLPPGEHLTPQQGTAQAHRHLKLAMPGSGASRRPQACSKAVLAATALLIASTWELEQVGAQAVRHCAAVTTRRWPRAALLQSGRPLAPGAACGRRAERAGCLVGGCAGPPSPTSRGPQQSPAHNPHARLCRRPPNGTVDFVKRDTSAKQFIHGDVA